MPEQKTITIALDDWIVACLGHEKRGCRAISKEAGLITHELIKKSNVYVVQFYDWDEKELTEPLLWSYPEWAQSEVKRKNLLYQNEQRERQYELHTANLIILLKHIQKEMFMEFNEAKSLAFMLYRKKKFQNIKALGVVPLTRVEDIPAEIRYSKIDVRIEAGALMGIEVIK
jgi:hypothetical protein